MKSRLYVRFAVLLIALTSVSIVIALGSVIVTTHYHFTMFANEHLDHSHNLQGLNRHLEYAVLESVIWTAAGIIGIVTVIGIYTAKRISQPLVKMKTAAEFMTAGDLNVRIQITGDDELSQLGYSLNKLAERLQQQEQLRISMTEDIAHELRTPLTTLKSHIRAFEDGIWEPTPPRIHSCYEEIERLTLLIGDLEDLIHVESPSFQLTVESQPIQPLIQRSISSIAAAYEEKDVRLLTIADQSHYAAVDSRRFIQIMVNLLTNALKYTPEGGEVRIETYADEESLRIQVADNGIGILESDIPHIFERFYRGDKSRNRKTGGSGLGLTIVEKLVIAHGGTITVKSYEETIFTITMPKDPNNIRFFIGAS